MSTMFGADADALDEVAADLARRAERLRTARARLARAIHGSPWEGPNARRFRQQWDAEHGPTLLAAAGFLDAAGEVLRHNAGQQREVSGADGARGPGEASTFSDSARGAVEATSLFDLGDSDLARAFRLGLGFVPGLGTIVVAEDLRQLIVDLGEGDATAQQVEDRVLDVVGAAFKPVGLALAGREAVGIVLPDDLEGPIFTILGLDPPLDEAISNVDALRRGDWSEVDLLQMAPPLVPGLRLDGVRDLYGALRRRVG